MIDDLEKYEALATVARANADNIDTTDVEILADAILELVAMVREQRNIALEEAAKVCEGWLPTGGSQEYRKGYAAAAEESAEAIRELKG